MVVPLLVTVAVGVTFVWQVERLLDLMRWVEHTDQVIEVTRRIETRMSRIVREARESLIEGSSQEEFTVRREEVLDASQVLMRLVADNPAQRDRASTLISDVQALLQMASPEAAPRRGAQPSPEEENPSVRGHHHRLGEKMDALAAQFDAFVNVEERLRLERSARAANAARFTTWSALALALLLGGALALQGNRALTVVSRRYERANAAIVAHAEAQRQRDEESRSIVEGVMGHAIVLLSPDGEIRKWNAGAERLKGYRAEEIIGKPFSLFFTPEDQRAGVPERILSAAREHGITASEGWRVRKDGTRFYGQGTVSALRDRTGRAYALVKITRDMTEHRQTEEKILQLNQTLERRVEDRTAELAAVNRELEAFSYSVSHDLRAPLRSVDGFGRLLQERYADQFDAQGQHYLSRIRAAAQRMATLIEDLLRLSRVTRAEMKDEDVDLATIARRVVEDLHRNDPARDVVFEAPSSLPIRGDRRLLEIALENLLSNAWKFTGRLARAHLELGTIGHADGKTEYFVRDDGVGFDMAFASRLFSPFQRLHDAEDFPGTGIGLATVQRVVSRHGGEIRAEAAPGKGATFYFTLGEM